MITEAQETMKLEEAIETMQRLLSLRCIPEHLRLEDKSVEAIKSLIENAKINDAIRLSSQQIADDYEILKQKFAEASVAVMPEDEKLRETIVSFLNTFEESGEYDYCVKDIVAYFKSFPHIVLPDPEMGAKRYDEIYQKLYHERIRSGWAGSPESLQEIIQGVKIETMSRFLAELLSGKPKEENRPTHEINEIML